MNSLSKEELGLKEWIQQLIDENVGQIKLDESLSNHTSWRIGGSASAFIIPDDILGLKKTVEILNQRQTPWKVIGKGSNLLVLDKGFKGAIISLSNKAFQDILINDSLISVGSNFSLVRLANLAAKEGLTGLEFAGGIPGTVGGAIYMNAGAHGSNISKILLEGEVLSNNGKIVKLKKEDFEFDYRTSILQNDFGIVLSATFKLELGNRKKIASDMAQFKDRRRRTQPYNLPCSGSVFRNPEGDFSGRLIEELGLKGFQIGGAQVSKLHANFIVNVNHASARDVLDLIDYIKDRVRKAYNVDLVPEVELLGED